MAQKILGIDLGASTVKVVVATNGFRGIQIVHSDSAKVELDPKKGTLASAVDAAITLIRAHGWEHMSAAVSLPAGSVSYRVLHFPFPDPKRIAQTLAFEVDGKFAQPTDELVYDHLPAVSGNGDGLGVVGAISEESARVIRRRFKSGGVEVRTLTSGAFALGQIAAALETPATSDANVPGKPVSLVLDIGHRATEAVVLSGHQVVAARSFRLGAQSIRRILKRQGEPHALEEVQLSEPLVEAQQAAFGPLAREVERLIHWLDADCAFFVSEILLTGGLSRVPGLDLWLSSEVARPTRVVQFKDSRVASRVSIRSDYHSWAAIGAAHAGLRRPLIDLQSVSSSASDNSDLLRRRLVSVVVLGVSVLACAGADTLAKVKAERRQRDAYRQELALLSEGVFGTPVQTLQDVEMLLASVNEGESGVVPRRSALDLLALITKAASPAKAGDESGGAEGEDSPAADIDDKKPESDGDDEETSTEEEVSALPVVPVEAGIVEDDRLHIRSADIREFKVALNVAATRASARDRLKRKLQEIPCIKSITTGTTREYNEFQEFAVNFDHDCFHQALTVEAE